MKTLLLIVDPQNDFITGSLPVPEAIPAMDLLASHLSSLAPDAVYVTMDAHPFGHISFESRGGEWPTHCVKYSEGAAIYPALMTALIESADAGTPVHFLEKGTSPDRDEYSAFAEEVPSEFTTADNILVCGLAGDVCVHTTLSDLCKHGLSTKLEVLTDASPSLDGGAKLQALILERRLRQRVLKDSEQASDKPNPFNQE